MSVDADGVRATRGDGARPPAVGVSRRPMHWATFGVANLVAILVISLITWFVLVDPEWSPLSSYPEPYTAVLFWALIVVVWTGFNLEFHGFDRFAQPLRGTLLLLITAAGAGVITFGLAYGWGHFDASFAADRAGGAGYFTGAVWVLFAFFLYVMSVVNWGNWPFNGRLRQPWLGLAQIGLLAVPTTIMYCVFGLTSLATWVDPARTWLTTNTAIGYFYAVIVSVVITGLLTENWPWRAAGSPARVALASLVGNIAVGTVLYYALGGVARLLLGSANVDALGPAITSFPAQLGVCWVFWMICWQNCFGNKPTTGRLVFDATVRVVVTLALGILTFVAYYYVIAEHVLHEPAVTSSIAGSALGWMDWLVLWMLLYVLAFQSLGLRPPAAVEAEQLPELIEERESAV